VKEYSVAAIVAAGAALVLDRLLGTRLAASRRFWIFQALMIPAQFLVNGYLTGRPIVLYGSEFSLGIRLFTIPIEDFLYGFSLMSFSLIFWEYFRQKSASS
jgi:lycopene cyclase domain-containing protein